jgi:modification methylase
VHPPSKDHPTQAQLVFPLLQAVSDLGTARPADVAEALADRFDLGEELRGAITRDARGRPTRIWDRFVRYGRERGKQMGFIASPRYGVWQLSPEGKEALSAATPRFRVRLLAEAESGAPVHATIDLDMALPTLHTIRQGDARDLSWLPANSIQLGLTSPPYLDLKAYDGGGEGQLGNIADLDTFLRQMKPVWQEYFRVLQPGGRLFVNVGDIVRSRKVHGRHHVLPLTDYTRVQLHRIGFDCLNYIFWHKLGNVRYEQGGAGAFLGQPNQPNGNVKLEHERILAFIKPGGYRKPTVEQKLRSRIENERYQAIFRQVWSDLPGASTRGEHPAPFPAELARRIIEGWSFVGDTVLDVFAGQGTVMLEAMKLGRSSVGVDISPTYCRTIVDRALGTAETVASAA